MDAITVGTKVVIEKGCQARGVTKGATAVVKAVEELGSDYSHMVRVSLWFANSFLSGKTLTFYVRHANRLVDTSINMNDGRPENKIVIRRKS